MPSIPPHIQPLIDTLPDDITVHQRAEVARLLCKYQGVFMGPDGRLGQTHIVEHTIDTGDTRPIKQPPRRAPIAMRGVVEEIHKMLDNGVIRPSNSPWSSPVVLVRKKDGTVRFCVDYRLLNDRTRKDGYPLPNISETLDTLAGSSWYNVLDMASGFWQCSMSQDDRPKTAFATHKGLFEFNVMPFGLANAPATFQRLVSLVLQGVHWKRCLAYLDDLLVPGGSFPDTLDNLGLVLDRLQRANLRLRPDKCRLFQRSVKYLGPDAACAGSVSVWGAGWGTWGYSVWSSSILGAIPLRSMPPFLPFPLWLSPPLSEYLAPLGGPRGHWGMACLPLLVLGQLSAPAHWCSQPAVVVVVVVVVLPAVVWAA